MTQPAPVPMDHVSSGDAQYAEVSLTTPAVPPSRSQLEAQPNTNKPEMIVVDINLEKETEPKEPSVWLLLYCCLGILVSISLNQLIMEKLTSHRALGEMSLTFAFSLCYAVAALGLRAAHKEQRSTMPRRALVLVGALAFGSTISSILALRYVTFIARILGKSCKSIPVMLVGLCFGKRYAVKKYLSVIVLCSGVALFLVGSNHHKPKHGNASPTTAAVPTDTESNVLIGSLLLVVSLLFDGATGALEDRLLEKYHIGAFDLMFSVNFWKSVFALVGMSLVGEMPTFVQMAIPAMPNLVMLGATGALGQAFIFFTLSKFGALTTAIIGTCRKVISVVLSVIFFGHVLAMGQVAGIVVAFTGISLNWLRCEVCGRTPGQRRGQNQRPTLLKSKAAEANELLESCDNAVDSDDDSTLSPTLSDDEDMTPIEVQRGRELVTAWQSETETDEAVENAKRSSVPAGL